jgi:hypothetical protein
VKKANLPEGRFGRFQGELIAWNFAAPASYPQAIKAGAGLGWLPVFRILRHARKV